MKLIFAQQGVLLNGMSEVNGLEHLGFSPVVLLLCGGLVISQNIIYMYNEMCSFSTAVNYFSAVIYYDKNRRKILASVLLIM